MGKLFVFFGRFPFNKNFGLKCRKFHVPNGTVHSGCTDRLFFHVTLMPNRPNVSYNSNRLSTLMYTLYTHVYPVYPCIPCIAMYTLYTHVYPCILCIPMYTLCTHVYPVYSCIPCILVLIKLLSPFSMVSYLASQNG